MKKITLFLIIVGIGILGYILFPIIVILFKITVGVVIGAIVVGILALGWYVAKETSKHK